MSFLPGLSTVRSMFDYIIGGLFVGAVLLVYYEGIPIVRDIPFVSYVPIVGDVAVGRVEKASDAAVKAATKDLISLSEKTALQAQIKEMERQRQAADAAANAARAQADKATKEATDAKAKLDAAIAADTGADGARWSQSDLDWLSKH